MRPRNFWVPKRVSTPKGAQISPIWNISVFQVEIPSNNVYRPNFKTNGWKLLNLWPTALVGTQNYPIPIGPFRGKIRYVGPYHLLDIINKEKPAKFHTKRTAGSKVMRPRNFWVPKRVNTPKGPKSGPYEICLFFRWRYPKIMGTNQIWRETGLNFSIQDRPNNRSQNCPISQTPILGRKLEILTMPVRRYPIYSRACQVSNPSDTRSQSYRAPYFWSQKWASTKNPLSHPPDPDFIGGFCSCGGSNQFLKIWAKSVKPISYESASKFWAQIFNGPKKGN